jgi:hypothetical protein
MIHRPWQSGEVEEFLECLVGFKLPCGDGKCHATSHGAQGVVAQLSGSVASMGSAFV